MSFRVKITLKSGDVWYASSMQTHATPELTVRHLNLVAKRKNTGDTYELATEEEYQAYRTQVRAAVEEVRKPFSPKYWTSLVPKKCDGCHVMISDRFYDMATRDGRWGCLCPVCANFGPGVGKLGTGFGQEYKRQDDGRWLKIGG